MSTELPRAGDWFLSSKARRLWPLDMRAEDVDIEEIAHSLSNLCRFGGHCREFYSVAQHSVYVALSVPAPLQLGALLHDATEAYCGDMVRPLKKQLSRYEEIEAGIWRVIAEHFGLPIVLADDVDRADCRVLLAEKRDLLPSHEFAWAFPQAKYPALLPAEIKIQPWGPRRAEREFLAAYDRIQEASGR